MTSGTTPSELSEPSGPAATRGPADAAGRWAWIEVDLDAIAHNVGVLRRVAAPAAVWAVVKADGYGHGAVAVARRAVQAGAEGLCVALVAEGVALRGAGIEAPILVLSEQPVSAIDTMVRHRLVPTLYTAASVDAFAARARDRYPVHLKVDTGMQRVGVAVGDAVALARRIAASAPRLELAGVFTHLACADEPASPATAEQLAAFDAVLAELTAAGLRPPLVHAANSAGALAVPAARRSLVRAGIAMYGITPGSAIGHLTGELRPALAVKARVAYVKRVRAGSHVSYGWRHRFERDTTVATLPLGYADGIARRLGTLPDRPGADVLIGGRRCPIVGVVTMDQCMVDVGVLDAAPGPGVSVGDEAVLIGHQGDERITVDEWADRLGTIGYEIVCGLGARVPRLPVSAPARRPAPGFP